MEFDEDLRQQIKKKYLSWDLFNVSDLRSDSSANLYWLL
jgi:hypothetical protein